MSPLRLRSLIPALIAAAALTGCSRDGLELARVGEHTITVGEFQDVARGNEVQYPGTDASAKQALLDDLVKRQLMIEAARRRGDDTTAAARRYRETLEREVAQQALVDELSPQKVAVSDAEVRAFHAARRQAVDVSLVFTADHDMLRYAREQLAAGVDFGDVADRVNSPGMLPPRGALGPTLWGQLIPPLDNEMLRLPVGAVGGPYETPQGWFMLRVNGRAENEQAPLAQQQSALAEVLRQRKQRAALTERLADLRGAYRVRLEPDAAQTLFELLQPARMGETVDFSRVDRTSPVARWSGGVYTMGDALADLERERDRPPYAMLPALQGWLENMVMQRVTVEEARRRHLLEQPRVARTLRARWEEFLMDGVYASTVSDVPPPDEAQVLAFYESAKGQFARLQRARVYRLLTSDSAKVFQVARTGGHGGTLREVAARVDPALQVDELVLDFPNADPDWSAMEQAFVRLPLGEWDGPVLTYSGWRVLQLLDRATVVPTFDQLDPQLRQRIQMTVTEMERDRRLASFTDSLRTTLAVRVNTANLARAPWPAPRVIDVGP